MNNKQNGSYGLFELLSDFCEQMGADQSGIDKHLFLGTIDNLHTATFNLGKLPFEALKSHEKANAYNNLFWTLTEALRKFHAEYSNATQNSQVLEFLLEMGWNNFCEATPSEYVGVIEAIDTYCAKYDEDEFFERFLYAIDWADLGVEDPNPSKWKPEHWENLWLVVRDMNSIKHA